jgi:hypothetical protein
MLLLIMLGLNVADTNGLNLIGTSAIILLIVTIIVGLIWLVYLTYDGI